MRYLLLALLMFGAGFGAGLYSLPMLQELSLPRAAVANYRAQMDGARRGIFRRNLSGSDWLHWGEGQVRVSARVVAFENVSLAPGPDYKLYLVPQFVDNEADFLRFKAQAVRLGDVRHFSGDQQFAVPTGVNVERYEAVLVWCESFRQFITAAKLYRNGEHG